MGLFVQVSLVSQIWPSGQEPGSQPQGPGSIEPSPMDSTLVPLVGAPSVFLSVPKIPCYKCRQQLLFASIKLTWELIRGSCLLEVNELNIYIIYKKYVLRKLHLITLFALKKHEYFYSLPNQSFRSNSLEFSWGDILLGHRFHQVQ